MTCTPADIRFANERNQRFASDIQELMLYSAPFRLKYKHNEDATVIQERAERLAQFESMALHFFVRHDVPGSDSAGTKRMYFPKPNWVKTPAQSRAIFARCLHVCGITASSSKGFTYTLPRNDRRYVMVGPKQDSMCLRTFTPDLLADAPILTLKYLHKKTCWGVSMLDFESRVRVFQDTFKDIFVQIQGVPYSKPHKRHYMVRAELAMSVNDHCDLAQDCLTYCGLHKIAFELHSVSDRFAVDEPEALRVLDDWTNKDTHCCHSFDGSQDHSQ